MSKPALPSLRERLAALRSQPLPPSVSLPPAPQAGYRPTFDAELWQHPVGQGFFHSGRVDLGGDLPFRYVYDCGKIRGGPWPRILEPVVARYERRQLDAIFISHFDTDHVNGLGRLLNEFEGAKRAFLPYIHPARRLLVAARDLERGVPLSEDHIVFLDNPTEWLRRSLVESIIYVAGVPDPDGVAGPKSPEFPIPGTTESTTVALSSDAHPPRALLVCPRELGSDVSFMNHRDPIVVSRASSEVGWVFQTYVDPDSELESSVGAAVRRALGPQGYAALLAGTVGLAALLRESRTRAKVCEAYRHATRSRPIRWKSAEFSSRRARTADDSPMNRSTMSVYSGPVSRSDKHVPLNQMFAECAVKPTERVRRLSRQRTGWLLTGDAVLGDIDVAERFVEFFSSKPERWLKRVRVLTVPHHGSERNFSDVLIRQLGNPPVAVVPAGNPTDRPYHPSGDVLCSLRRRCRLVVHVDAKLLGGVVHRITVPRARRAFSS